MLTIEKQWLAAESEDSPSLPVPTHLRIVWRDNLPYWHGLTDQDRQNLLAFYDWVGVALAGQATKLTWLAEQIKAQDGLYPAFVPLGVPQNALLHPEARFDCPTYADLVAFTVKAINLENLEAWQIDSEKVAGQVAVAAAPWFWDEPNRQNSQHSALIIAKVDYYIFE
jgi:hypothetical protein